MKLYRHPVVSVVLWLLLPLIASGLGCSSGDLGTVKGTVKADGQPLPDAMVTFYPEGEGRASSGLTDEDGNYELTYTRGKKGAVIGEHTVHVSTAIGIGEDGEKTAKERIPTKYNMDSELRATVKAGRNVHDFAVELKGRVVQPGN